MVNFVVGISREGRCSRRVSCDARGCSGSGCCNGRDGGSGGNSVTTSIFLFSNIAIGGVGVGIGGGGGAIAGGIVSGRWGHELKAYSG